ncbi:MAG: YeiH family protein [Clostridia bacterium]|nr:YeiH family protein [Clostridia bacterium]
MNKLNKIIPGILLCFAIASPAWFLGKALPLIGSPVFAILLGMFITMVYPKVLSKKISITTKNSVSVYLDFDNGVKYTSKNLLQYSIVLLGFEMNLFNIIKVGGQSLLIILFTLTSAFLTAFFIGKALKINGKTATLIGVGTSICGGSAIAATAPVIGAKSEDVAQAISTIFLFNIIAVFIFPSLGHMLNMSDIGFGMWAGTAINDTSSVVASGTAWSNAAGNNTALTFATIVKLTRTLMIVPITLVLAIYTAKKTKAAANGGNFSFYKVFPWFVIGFVAAAVINTFAGIPATSSHGLATIGKFLIVMAMAGIGLNTHLKKLLTNGLKPIFLGLCCWFAVASISLLVQIFTKIW